MAKDGIAELERRAEAGVSGRERIALLRDIIDAHGEVPADSDEAQALRRLFVHQLDPRLEEDRDRFGRFLAEHVEPQDFAGMDVESPDHAMDLFRMLARFRYDTDDRAEQVQRHVQVLLRSTLQRYEERGDLERMFELLQTGPVTDSSDPELMRLRSRAHLFEMTRARWRRRALYVYLIAQTVLVTILFPLLFINAENGKIQEELSAAVNIEVDEGSPRQTLSFADGVYWSIITAASIGYGDITPRTEVGRMIAAILGTLGVLTVGVMAGLILYWITPRRLQ